MRPAETPAQAQTSASSGSWAAPSSAACRTPISSWPGSWGPRTVPRSKACVMSPIRDRSPIRVAATMTPSRMTSLRRLPLTGLET